MKLLPLIAINLLVLFCFSAGVAQSPSEEVSILELTNSDILTMVKAKLSPELIIVKIKTSRCRFDTYPSVLAELKYKGVPDDVLLAMVDAPVGPPRKPVTHSSLTATQDPGEPQRKPDERTSRVENIGGVILHDRSESPFHARFFVAPMEEGFDGLISAVIIEKKLPLSLVADENLADFVIVGGTNKGTHKWYDTVFGSGYERDRNQGSIRIIRVRDKTVIWGAQKGDRSLWWGALKKGGKRKVAERLVNAMKSSVFKDRF